MIKVKYLAAVLLAAALILTASGCDLIAFGQTETPEAEETVAAQVVYGKIKEINGNELLLAIGEMASSGGMEGFSGIPPDQENSGTEDGSPPEGMPSGMTGQGGRGGTGGRGGESSGEAPTQSSADTSEMPAQSGGAESPAGASGRGTQGGQAPTQQSITLTGEEISYQIPVTAQVVSGQGENVRTISFTQLAYKNVVCLSLDEEGRIFKVEVLQ